MQALGISGKDKGHAGASNPTFYIVASHLRPGLSLRLQLRSQGVLRIAMNLGVCRREGDPVI